MSMPIDLPLSHWRVLVTRPSEQARPLLEALQTVGARAISYPTIALEPPPSWTPFDSAVGRLDSYDWIIFTSPSASRFAFARAPHLADSLQLAGAPKVAAVGTETARRLASYGVPVAVVPENQRQEGLVTALGHLTVGTRVLFPQALGGRELLRDQLVLAGASVDVVPVSQTVALDL
ncbi:MAG: uroporphyrinogen-III synthase, partial [Deltaproteobacteria bacterium]|nr:uroporphyrinogen-III synthase [Deltaproteobacteria bacterium]